jgi:outer membrane protein assembly factor BamD
VWVLALVLFAPSVAAARRGDASSAGANDRLGAEQLYEQGLRQMRNGYYTKALESFNRVRNYHRDDPVSLKAQLAIADLHFKKGDLQQANLAYKEFAALHPRHENLDYVTWRIGLSIYKRAPQFAGRDQTATREAVDVWTGFDSRFPESEHNTDVHRLLDRSRERLAAKELYIARFYVKRKAWGAVRGRTEGLARRYPDSSHMPKALEFLGRSLHAWGYTDQAVDVRARLEEIDTHGSHLRKLDRVLDRPAGEPPDEKVFIRPYRIRGTISPTGTEPVR